MLQARRSQRLPDLSIRRAEQIEAAYLAAIELHTAPEFANFLLDGLFPDVSVGEALSRIYARSEGVDSYLWSWIAQIGEDRVGAIGAYPATLMVAPNEQGEAAERIAFFEPIRLAMRPDAFHISRLGVLGGFRRAGVAQGLVSAAVSAAGAHGEKHVTLFVWQDNEPALGLYKKLGFKEIDRVEIPPHPRMERHGTSLLLSRDL